VGTRRTHTRIARRLLAVVVLSAGLVGAWTPRAQPASAVTDQSQPAPAGCPGAYVPIKWFFRHSNTTGTADSEGQTWCRKSTEIPIGFTVWRLPFDRYSYNGFFDDTEGMFDVWGEYWPYVLYFGGPGDVPLVGDWNGDRNDELAVYREGSFHFSTRDILKFPTTTSDLYLGAADWTAVYGNPGDTPLVGDWDGDGVDTIGVYRDGVFYLRNSNTTGTADITFAYGNPGDIPLAGRWTKLFTSVDPYVFVPDTVGVDRDGVFYLRNSNTTGTADITFQFGDPGDIPLVGDWIETQSSPQSSPSYDTIALLRHIPPESY
jgi:hypothetical protein